jgi:SprT-like family
MRLFHRRADPAQLELAVAAATPRTADEMLARLRALGLRGIERCTLTRNHTVMVSVRAGELRLHEGYREAGEPVLRAIVAFTQGRTRAERRAAQRTIIAAAAPMRGPARAPERTRPEDEPLVARLLALHGRLNVERFDGGLRPIVVRVSRRMKSRLGHYVPTGAHSVAEIVVSRRHVRRDDWDEVVDTMLHEMVHQWQDETGMPVDHGAAFKRKARDVGATPTAKREVTQSGTGHRLADVRAAAVAWRP